MAAAAVALVLLLVISACSSKAGAGGGRDSGGVLKLTDPGNDGVLAYAKKHGILDKALAKVHAKVEWGGSYPAFSETVAALNAGSINLMTAAVSPALGAIAHNSKLKIVTVSDPGVSQAGILVPHNSSIHDLHDLVGKKVAVNQAAHGEYIVLLALKNAGIPANKVKRVYLQPTDAASAFATGKIDAWSIFATLYVQAVKSGARVIINESDLRGDNDLGMTAVRSDFLKAHPEIVRVYYEVTRELTIRMHAHPAEFENVFETKGPRALSGDRLKAQIEEDAKAPIPRLPTANDRKRVQEVADFFYQYKVLPQRLDTSTIVADPVAAGPTAAGNGS